MPMRRSIDVLPVYANAILALRATSLADEHVHIQKDGALGYLAQNSYLSRGPPHRALPAWRGRRGRWNACRCWLLDK